MSGIDVDDPERVLLAMSCLAIVVLLAAVKWRQHDFLPPVVLSAEVGLVVVFWWNTTMPDSLDLDNSLYFTIAWVGVSAGVFGLWAWFKGTLVALVVAALMLALLIAGRDKVEGAFDGGVSYTVLTLLLVLVVLALLALAWWSRHWHRVWEFVSNVCMGFGLGLAINVVAQEAANGPNDLDLLDFSTSNTVVLAVYPTSVGAYLLLYYRHVVAPCWFTAPPRPVLLDSEELKLLRRNQLMQSYSRVPREEE